jgi:hypothetical protein
LLPWLCLVTIPYITKESRYEKEYLRIQQKVRLAEREEIAIGLEKGLNNMKLQN